MFYLERSAVSTWTKACIKLIPACMNPARQTDTREHCADPSTESVLVRD